MTQATPEELDRWIRLLADWEDVNGTIAGIMPCEYEALMCKVRALAVTYSPRQAHSALDQVLAMQRGEVIEECAKVCQGLSAGYMRIGKVEQSDSCDECRDAIRALKG